MNARSYLDWNATAPLRPEARAAMAAAMDAVGNPSSVHGEGRRARAIIERARAQVAEALGAGEADIVFTSGATEAAALALAGRGFVCAGVEHDAVLGWARADLDVAPNGLVRVDEPATTALQLANGETGVVQTIPEGLGFCDATQAFGKMAVDIKGLGVAMVAVSAHKIGGPAGVGALIVRRGLDVTARQRGGGQEMGRRSGTENLIGIAGFGAAAEAAARDLATGAWQGVAATRDFLEATLAAEAREIIFVGKDATRLPNTACFTVPGWKGETQVMQMDLAGFAISAGSACSSGKVRASRVLTAMGLDEAAASSAIRVSLGLATSRDAVARFAEAWLAQYRKHAARAA